MYIKCCALARWFQISLIHFLFLGTVIAAWGWCLLAMQNKFWFYFQHVCSLWFWRNGTHALEVCSFSNTHKKVFVCKPCWIQRKSVYRHKQLFLNRACRLKRFFFWSWNARPWPYMCVCVRVFVCFCFQYSMSNLWTDIYFYRHDFLANLCKTSKYESTWSSYRSQHTAENYSGSEPPTRSLHCRPALGCWLGGGMFWQEL